MYNKEKFQAVLPSSLVISASNDYAALNAYFATKTSGRSIPEEISFGNSPNKSDLLISPVPLLGLKVSELSLKEREGMPSIAAIDGSVGDIGVVLSKPYSPQKLSSLVITSWVQAAKRTVNELSVDGKRDKKPKRLSVNIVVPSYFSQLQRLATSDAVRESGHSSKYIFPRALAAVAGALKPRNESEQSGLLELLLSSSSKIRGNCEPDVLFLHVGSFWVDIGVVRCEGAERALKSGIKHGFERIALVGRAGFCSVEHSAIISSVEASAAWKREKGSRPSIEKIIAEATTVIEKCDAKDSLSAILLYGLETQEKNRLCSFFAVQSIGLREGDIAGGGCMLAAAELESSKQYIAKEDGGWSILHSLPLGEEVLMSSLKIREQLYEGGEKHYIDFVSPFSRIWKTDMGPARKGKRSIPKIIREYKWGPVFGIFRKSGAIPPGNFKPGWPKVDVVESEEGKKDQVVAELTPLYDDENGVVISESSLTLSVDASSGTLSISNSKGDSVANVQAWYWLICQISIFIIIVTTMILIFIYYNKIVEAYNYSQDTSWLQHFYEHNAPEKLANDPNLVKKIMDKNYKKMFVLWRKLQQTYDVKWDPPYSISENTEL